MDKKKRGTLKCEMLYLFFLNMFLGIFMYSHINVNIILVQLSPKGRNTSHEKIVVMHKNIFRRYYAFESAKV